MLCQRCRILFRYSSLEIHAQYVIVIAVFNRWRCMVSFCDIKVEYLIFLTLKNIKVCAGYARFTLSKLPRLQWLDMREVLPTDRPDEHSEIHPDDLRSTYFNFTIFRIISAPQPPKGDKVSINNIVLIVSKNKNIPVKILLRMQI